MENKKNQMIEELKMIQEIIKRFSSNSFIIKGWVITLIVAGFLFSEGNKFQLLIAIIPLLMFWFLDAYYLRQERLYRRLYNWVKTNRLSGNKEFSFDLSVNRFKDKKSSIITTMFSKTLFVFYGFLALIFTFLYILFINQV